MATSGNFDTGVLYQIKLDTVGDYREHAVIQCKAAGTGPDEKVTMYGPSSPSSMSIRSKLLEPPGTVTYDKAAALPNGVEAFAGPRKDPFYFDLTQLFKMDPDRNYRTI